MLDGDRRAGGHDSRRRGGPSLEHLHTLERGEVLRHRIVQFDPALLVQRHDGHTGDDLGHRVDAEDRVLLHRQLPGDVTLAPGAPLDNAALACQNMTMPACSPSSTKRFIRASSRISRSSLKPTDAGAAAGSGSRVSPGAWARRPDEWRAQEERQSKRDGGGATGWSSHRLADLQRTRGLWSRRGERVNRRQPPHRSPRSRARPRRRTCRRRSQA